MMWLIPAILERAQAPGGRVSEDERGGMQRGVCQKACQAHAVFLLYYT
jgi:hypothetical protein